MGIHLTEQFVEKSSHGIQVSKGHPFKQFGFPLKNFHLVSLRNTLALNSLLNFL